MNCEVRGRHRRLKGRGRCQTLKVAPRCLSGAAHTCVCQSRTAQVPHGEKAQRCGSTRKSSPGAFRALLAQPSAWLLWEGDHAGEGAHGAIAAPGRAGSEGSVTKSCHQPPAPRALPECHGEEMGHQHQPRVNAGALGQKATDTRGQLGAALVAPGLCWSPCGALPAQS